VYLVEGMACRKASWVLLFMSLLAAETMLVASVQPAKFVPPWLSFEARYVYRARYRYLDDIDGDGFWSSTFWNTSSPWVTQVVPDSAIPLDLSGISLDGTFCSYTAFGSAQRCEPEKLQKKSNDGASYTWVDPTFDGWSTKDGKRAITPKVSLWWKLPGPNVLKPSSNGKTPAFAPTDVVWYFNHPQTKFGLGTSCRWGSKEEFAQLPGGVRECLIVSQGPPTVDDYDPRTGCYEDMCQPYGRCHRTSCYDRWAEWSFQVKNVKLMCPAGYAAKTAALPSENGDQDTLCVLK